jgi:hypothetical protein
MRCPIELYWRLVNQNAPSEPAVMSACSIVISGLVALHFYDSVFDADSARGLPSAPTMTRLARCVRLWVERSEEGR